MRVGLALLAAKYTNKIPYRFRGKYRIVKKPSMDDLFKMKQDFEREEQNMLILRHPYLTLEQSYGYMKDMYPESRKQNFLEKVRAENRQKFQKEITIVERLCHMRVTEAWD